MVKKGDTLSAIAQRFGLDVGKLATVNGLANPDDIEAGQTLTFAGADRVTTTVP